jgi:hypothetical protein
MPFWGWVGIVVIALIFAVPTLRGRPQTGSQREQPLFELRADYLSAVGLHFPSYMPSVDDVMNYQAKLSTHQELTIEWTIIPGSDRPVHKDTVREGSLSSDFALVDRKQNVAGNARKSTLTLDEMALVTAAVTSSGEIRGLVVGPGSPLMRGERGGRAFVRPKDTFFVFLPNDPKIERLVFLLAHPAGEKYRLEQVGILELPQKRVAM